MVRNAAYAAEAGRLRFPGGGFVTGDFYRDSMILANDLRSLGLNIRSFREPLHYSVKHVMIPSIRQNFMQEGRPPWVPLSLTTVKIRGTAHPILQRSRTLIKVATQLNIWKIDRTSAVIDDIDRRVPYAKFHQGGTRKMPARPFAQITDEDQEEIENIFYEWFVYREMRKQDLY